MWWSELHTLQQVFFIIGCATLAFMVIQIVMMLIGVGDDDAFSGNVDADMMDVDVINSDGITNFGLNLISVRTIIAFLCIGSFALFFTMYYLPIWASVLIGIGAGSIAGLLMGLAMHGLSKMQSSGNIEIQNCIGKTAEVYLTIPAAKSGKGKINVLVQERYAEFEAVTDSSTPIKTGSQVMIISVSSDSVLNVKQI